MRRKLGFLALLATLSPYEASAIEHTFQHRFYHEHTASLVESGNESVSSSQPMPAPLTSLYRWNTYTIASEFGMESGGRVEIEIQNLTFLPFTRRGSTARVGPTQLVRTDFAKQVPVVFTLYDYKQWRMYAMLRLRDIPVQDSMILCHYPSVLRFAVTNATADAGHRVVFEVPKASLYTLQAQVCGESSVEIAGQARLVNIGQDGETTEHLAVEELGLIPVYKVAAFAYSVLTLFWILDCAVQRQRVPRIAYAFQCALHFKTAEMLFKYWYYTKLSQTGSHTRFVAIARSLVDSSAGGCLLGVQMLASLGWSLTRDQLGKREFRAIVLMLFVYCSVAGIKALCGDEDDVCKAYLLTEYIIKSVIMLGVVVALNFTISQLRLTIHESRWNSQLSPITYMKLVQYQKLRSIFLTNLLVPTILLVINLLVITPPGFWRYEWINSMLREVGFLLVYGWIALALRPLDPLIYSRISLATDNSEGIRVTSGHDPHASLDNQATEAANTVPGTMPTIQGSSPESNNDEGSQIDSVASIETTGRDRQVPSPRHSTSSPRVLYADEL